MFFENESDSESEESIDCLDSLILDDEIEVLENSIEELIDEIYICQNYFKKSKTKHFERKRKLKKIEYSPKYEKTIQRTMENLIKKPKQIQKPIEKHLQKPIEKRIQKPIETLYNTLPSNNKIHSTIKKQEIIKKKNLSELYVNQDVLSILDSAWKKSATLKPIQEISKIYKSEKKENKLDVILLEEEGEEYDEKLQKVQDEFQNKLKGLNSENQTLENENQMLGI